MTPPFVSVVVVLGMHSGLLNSPTSSSLVDDRNSKTPSQPPILEERKPRSRTPSPPLEPHRTDRLALKLQEIAQVWRGATFECRPCRNSIPTHDSQQLRRQQQPAAAVARPTVAASTTTDGTTALSAAKGGAPPLSMLSMEQAAARAALIAAVAAFDSPPVRFLRVARCFAISLTRNLFAYIFFFAR